MRNALGAKNKLQLVNRSVPAPKESDENFTAWQRCDLMVQSWILNSCSKEVVQCILYADTAADMWSLLEERFSQGNFPRIFELQKQIYATVQGNMRVTEYFNKLDSLWRELNQYNPMIVCACGVIKTCTCSFVKNLTEREERNMSIKFLMSLNEVYAGIRGQILVMKPFPTLNQIFSFVIQDESQRGTLSNSSVGVESIAMMSKGESASAASYTSSGGTKQGRGNGFQRNFQNQNQNQRKCGHCGFTNHTIDKCYQLHGFPPGYKGKGKQVQNQKSTSSGTGQNKAYAVTFNVDNVTKGNGDASGSTVTQDQYKHLLILIQNLAASQNTPLTPLHGNTDPSSSSGEGFEPEDWHG